MAKASKKTKRKTKKSVKARGAASATAKSGFKTFAVHATEPAGQQMFAALREERPTVPAFAIASAQPAQLDPESAAKRILRQALASPAVPSFTAPKVGGTESDFKSLGVETVPLTGTSVVKFRQQIKGIPVYGSLVSVELDDDNECISLDSNLATPDVKTNVAKVSPEQALKTAGAAAGYGRELPDATPALNYYRDFKGKWHLAYIMENVRVRKRSDGSRKKAADGDPLKPLVFDYVVDALTGSLIDELPRTPSMAAANDQAVDELGALKTFGVDVNGANKSLRDLVLNIETHDFRFRDPQVEGFNLPGALIASPPNFSPAAVSAHVNAAVVASFLRDVLKRNNLDGRGGALVSTVNCVVKREARPLGSRNWLNAFWDPDLKQMVYGQATFNNRLRSLAAALDVVAHELFHGVTDFTSRLEYLFESGALNESYSDIFGIIVSNLSEPDIAKWNFLIGDGISSGLAAFRDLQDPTRFGQPKLMKDFVRVPFEEDSGGVHTNSGIHNFAAFKVITARDPAGGFVFKAPELATMFFVALTQHLSRRSTFADSRRGVVLATRTFFRRLPQADLDLRVAAVEAGFDAAGIRR